MVGRKRVPTTLRILRGNPRQHAINRREPIPVGHLKKAPAWMSNEEKAEWDYAIENSPPALLKRLDSSTLSTWAVAVVLHRKASLAVTEYGLTTIHPRSGAEMVSPYVNALNKQALIVLRTAEQLGFSPASRSRIQLPAAEGSKDVWESFETDQKAS